jgi:hypothetical protein
MCKTGVCQEKVYMCLGVQDGETCIDHYQCDVGYGCIKEVTWPFASTCEKLRKQGEQCIVDQDCEIDHFCWYVSPDDAKAGQKQCLKMYKMDEFSEFGYLKDPKAEFKYQMQENMKYGKYCKSGMAVIDEANNSMKCVKIGSVMTNSDAYATKKESPYECKIHDGEGNAADDFESACKYYYVDETGADQLI